MYQLQAVDNLGGFLSVAPSYAPSAEAIARQKPAQSLVLSRGDRPLARCSIWTSGTPGFLTFRLGLIGHYGAEEAEAGREILARACDLLAAAGCTLAVGPMDGNTWQRYRLLTRRGPEPVFLMEPDNPDDWPGHWSDAGFVPLARYFSALNPDLSVENPRLGELEARVRQRGIVVRSIRLEDFEVELRRVHALALLSFRQNFLYTPISEEDFLEQYRGVQRFVYPELALLAELGTELVGFLFAIPDLLQAQRGQPMDTVILKTLAVRPDHEGFGLGSYLLERAQAEAQRLGFRRAIHALFHEQNRSGKISSHTAQIMREYVLYSRPLKGRVPTPE